MSEHCIFCGADDHEVVETVIGKVMACPRMPTDRAIMLSPKSIKTLEGVHQRLGDFEIERLALACGVVWKP